MTIGAGIIPSVTATVLSVPGSQPVQDNTLSIIGIIGTFSRGPLQTPTLVSDPQTAVNLFGPVDDLSNSVPLTGQWAVQQAMAQGAQQIMILRVGDALFSTLTLLDYEQVTVTGGAITGSGTAQFVTVSADPITAGFLVGQTIAVGGASPENVVITALSATQIKGIFTLDHLNGVTLTQQADVVTLTPITAGSFGNNYTVAVAAGTVDNTVTLTITGDGKTEVWPNLSMTPGTANYLPAFINLNSTLVAAVADVSPNLPAVLSATPMTGGTNGNVTEDSDYIGTASPPTGLYALDNQIVDILVCAGQSDAPIHAAMDTHAQDLQNRISIVGGALGDSVAATVTRAAALASDRSVLCYPGIQVYDPNQNLTVTLPSAYTAAAVAGIIATLDPYRSPSNKQFVGILGFEVPLALSDLVTLIQGNVLACSQVNRLGFRTRDGYTTTPLTPFNQISIRRLFDQIVRGVTETNIDLVSAPNDEGLWHELLVGIDDYMDQLLTPDASGDQAIQNYYSTVVSSPSDQQAGYVYAEIGVAPTYPADFIVIQIAPNATGALTATVVPTT